MAKTIQQIKQDLEVLEQGVAEIAEQLRNVYLQYLSLLGQSVQKQLMLASYQLCTQIYPEAFLLLSYNQRQKTQQNLRQLVQKIQPQLLAAVQIPLQLPASQTANLLERILQQLPINKKPEASQVSQVNEVNKEVETLELNVSSDLKTPKNNLETEYPIAEIPQEIKEKLSKIKNHPETVIQWQKQLEKAIGKILDQLSHDANQTLQQAKILPSQLPTKFLEVAIQAEENGAAVSGPPNLLNLLIETETEEESEETNITQITVIHLRLPEIEFADPPLSAQRQQIRQLLAKLGTIKQQYQKKQKELAVAEAESAWRSSWYED